MKSNLDESRPIFLQISEMIEENILDGEFHEGDKVPSTNELASFYKINPATAAKGIQVLVDKEIIFKRRGIGMFVNEGAKEKLINERKIQFRDHFIKPMLYEAKRLEMTKEDIIKFFMEEDK
ncbi:GntR family transcriptional regulator [Evansella sp. AB-P1]|uniref:GntR family transcriptional regulator n=1 Tax=Evansella sp. AB-P1 TaxID=3037653 RepID=UPI00241FCB51|nr:GntR family transcriptional regulator [Evansella sp. AB-P1]MDG5786277.1 GntR family transcriptional regulator [Evansella sp. AB-P1]